MTDEEIMAVLTEIPPERFDPGLRTAFERAERDGCHLTVFEVAGLVDPPELAPVIIITHVAARPSMKSIREAFLSMRNRCARDDA